MNEHSIKTIEDFTGFIKEHLFEDISTDSHGYEIESKEVLKNNGIILHGILVKDLNSNTNIFPTFYLDQYFHDYLNGVMPDEIISRIRSAYEANKNPEGISVDFFNDFTEISDRLSIKVINYNLNRDFLKMVPYYKYGDLAAIFQVQMNKKEYGTMSITIKKEHMRIWNVTPKQLLEAATSNMEQKQPSHITSITEALNGLIGAADTPGISDFDPQMYILSNESKINGAAGIIFTDKLHDFATEKGADIYILPSSLHELILIPAREGINVEDLKAMVKEVNSTCLSPEERLSDNVYVYDRNQKRLLLADTREILELIDESSAA